MWSFFLRFLKNSRDCSEMDDYNFVSSLNSYVYESMPHVKPAHFQYPFLCLHVAMDPTLESIMDVTLFCLAVLRELVLLVVINLIGCTFGSHSRNILPQADPDAPFVLSLFCLYFGLPKSALLWSC